MSEILNDLQLSPVEEKVYLLLLSAGQMSVPEIAEQVGAKFFEVNQCIESLIAKKLVFTNPSIIKKFSATYPLVSLSEKAKVSLDTIKTIGDEVNTFAAKRFEKLDQIVKQQKVSMQTIATTSKEGVRSATEVSAIEIATELDKLIEEISLILNSQSQQVTSMSMSTLTDLGKHYQETTEAAGNSISSAVSDIANSLSDSEINITKNFDESASKVEFASATMEESLKASLENNFNDYSKTTVDIQQKVDHSLTEYDKAANDTMGLYDQSVRDNYASIITLVSNKLGLHDKETNQILDERIRIIIQSMNEMNDDFAKVVKDRLSAVKRESNQMIESFSRNVDTLFTDANAQLESLIAAKTNINEQKMSNLFKLLKENLQKNAGETKEEIRSKEIRLGNELKVSIETTQRKMTEINDKINMELTNSFNKANTDFSTSKNNMIGTITRAKTDVDTKFSEARDAAITSIKNEFSEQEKAFTTISSRIIDDVRALNLSSETKGKSFIKETEASAKTAIAKIEMPSKTLLNRGKQTALKFVNEQAQLVTKAIEQSQTGIEDSIIAETSNMKDQFKGFSEKYKESNKTIERLLANMELTYQELDAKIRDIQRPPVNTMTVIGQDAVLSQIKDIFSRVKSTVTIVYPEIKDIHVDALVNSNPRTRIIVIADFDPFKNADVIRTLMSKENIQLKSLAIGSTSKPYFAIGRDAEEALIGTLDDSGQVIAITSNSQAFVELINKEVINGIITPKTKRVVLPESQ